MLRFKKILGQVFVELLTIAILAIVSLFLLRVGVGKIESGYIAIFLVIAGASGIAIYRIGERHLRFLAASRSGIGPLYLFPNQLECQAEIIDNFKRAKKVKILAARGGRYFGIAGWFYELLREKRAQNAQIQVLVCSFKARHIDMELARELGYSSAEAVRERMRTSLEHLRLLCTENPNIAVRAYDKRPIWNILIFDDIMYVAPYVGHDSHERATVLKFLRNVRSHFVGFELYYDQLWSKSENLYTLDIDSLSAASNP